MWAGSREGGPRAARARAAAAGHTFIYIILLEVLKYTRSPRIISVTFAKPISRISTLCVSPWAGVVLNESFAVNAAAFVDDDLPLTYRFGYQMTNRAITVMVSSTVDILFFQLGGNVKEVCETTTTYNI
jgi:hypothetical protein